MKKLIFACLLLLLATLPANAAIARDGNCTAVGTSCTFSATAKNDLKIIFAFRSGSATAPSLPAGWKSIATRAQGTNSFRIGCNISSSSADTGSGTWTNATDVVGGSYSGTAASIVGMSCLSGTGANTTNSAAASTTVNFPTIQTLNDNTSWVAGFAADSAAIVGAPAGMTQFTTAGTGPSAAANDTNATVTSWSSTNVTVASSTWLTAVVEIVAPPSQACGAGVPCLVQSYSGPSNQGGETGNDFVFWLPNPTLANNFLICGLTYAFSAGRTVTVTDNVGTNTWVAGTTTSSANNTESFFYVLGVASGTQKIKVHFDAALFFWQPHCDEFYNVATSSATDGNSNAHSITGPTIAAGNITTTGTNDLIVHYGNVDDNGPGNANVITAIDLGAGFTDDGTDDLSAGLAQFFQHRIAPTATTINPTFGILQGTQNTFGSVAMAFKSATAGTAPAATGIRIIHKYDAIISPTSTTTLLFPSSGNLTIASFSIPVNQNSITSITDNLGNTYTKENPNSGACAGIGPQLFHADNATTGNGQTLTINQSTITAVTDVSMYDVTNAATSPWVQNTCNNLTPVGQFALTSVNGTGVYQGTITGGAANAFVGFKFTIVGFTNTVNNLIDATCTASTATALTFSASTTIETAAGSVTQDALDDPDITPQFSNGLIIGSLGDGAGPPLGTVNTALIYDSIYYTKQSDASKTNAGEGHFHYYNPNTTLIPVNWAMASSAAVGGAVGMATEFKAASGGAVPMGVNKRIKLEQLDGPGI